MRKTELAYLAGVMDSDGYFTMKRNTYNIRITKDSKYPAYMERVGIKQVQPQAIELIHKYFGGYKNIQKPNAKKGKPLHGVQLTNLKAHIFIKAIHPYLLLKKEQAEILLTLRKHLSKGKQGISIVICKNRWGQSIKQKRAISSREQIIYRQSLMYKIKSLNDSRNDAQHQPIPWE